MPDNAFNLLFFANGSYNGVLSKRLKVCVLLRKFIDLTYHEIHVSRFLEYFSI